MNPAVKFAAGADDVLEILAVPFSGPIDGKDTDGEFFSERTDLCLDWFPTDRPLLYHHGLDDGPGVSAVGRVDSTTASKAADGWWVQAQLDKSNEYFAVIKTLVEKGVLYASSGAMPHLTQRHGKTGEITRWPWVELSLTPTPANVFATVSQADAAKHYKAAGLKLRLARKAGLPDTPTLADGDDGDAPEGSYEDLIQDLTRLLSAQFGISPYSYGYVQVLATFPDYCICCVADGDGGYTYYEVAYSLPGGPLQDPVLGDSRQVQRAYTPKAVTERRLAQAVERYAATIDDLQAAMDGKAGRVLSAANESTLRHAAADIDKVLNSLT
jgi:hypothetical protein